MGLLPKISKKPSRNVKIEDIERMKEDAKEMLLIANKPVGKYPHAYALAHCQITENDPLRFFVMNTGELYINAKILGWNGEVTSIIEGCYSFPFRGMRKVCRSAEIDVEYQILDKNDKLVTEKGKFAGLVSRIFQHEIDHFNGIAIY